MLQDLAAHGLDEVRSRLVRDRGLSTTEAMAMIAAQMPAELKRARAHHVIENGGSREALERRVDEVWQELLDEAERAQPVS